MKSLLVVNNTETIDALMIQKPEETKECLRCASIVKVGQIGAYLVNFVCDTCRMDNNSVEFKSDKVEWTSEKHSEDEDVK